MEATVDKTFDRFEIFTLRNILTVPDDLAGWMRLTHYEVRAVVIFRRMHTRRRRLRVLGGKSIKASGRKGWFQSFFKKKVIESLTRSLVLPIEPHPPSPRLGSHPGIYPPAPTKTTSYQIAQPIPPVATHAQRRPPNLPPFPAQPAHDRPSDPSITLLPHPNPAPSINLFRTTSHESSHISHQPPPSPTRLASRSPPAAGNATGGSGGQG